MPTHLPACLAGWLQEPMPVDQLVHGLCDTKQGYTQYGGLRPFGVSLLYAGW